MNQKPVIAFVLPDLTAGGAEMVLIRLLNALSRERYHPVFVTVSNRGALKDYIDPALPFHTLDSQNVIKALPRLYKKLKEIKPDIVVTTMAHMNFAALMLKPFFFKTKFIVRESTLPACTLHGRGLMEYIIRFLYIALYPLADKIIAPAQIILQKMNAELFIPRKKMAVLPNPIDLKTLNGTGKSEKESTLQFIAAGRLHPEKGFDRLIKILKDYRNQNWKLTIIGEGDQRKELESMIRILNLSSHIDLPGFKAEPWKEFVKADYFLLPSRWEGSPNAALEALACGTPVIALREAGGIVEIAAEAEEGAITLVNNMHEFLKTISSATALTGMRTSLLPEKYIKENVMQRFEKILQDVL